MFPLLLLLIENGNSAVLGCMSQQDLVVVCRSFILSSASKRHAHDYVVSKRGDPMYCLFGVNKYFFLFSFFCLIWHVIERYGKSLILSKDEHLTPNIDGVLAL